MPRLFAWWGYLHIEGTLHLRRYFDADDIKRAKESPFVQGVYGPFDAQDHATAVRMLHEIKGGIKP